MERLCKDFIFSFICLLFTHILLEALLFSNTDIDWLDIGLPWRVMQWLFCRANNPNDSVSHSLYELSPVARKRLLRLPWLFSSCNNIWLEGCDKVTLLFSYLQDWHPWTRKWRRKAARGAVNCKTLVQSGSIGDSTGNDDGAGVRKVREGWEWEIGWARRLTLSCLRTLSYVVQRDKERAYHGFPKDNVGHEDTAGLTPPPPHPAAIRCNRGMTTQSHTR